MEDLQTQVQPDSDAESTDPVNPYTVFSIS